MILNLSLGREKNLKDSIALLVFSLPLTTTSKSLVVMRKREKERKKEGRWRKRKREEKKEINVWQSLQEFKNGLQLEIGTTN